MPALRNSFATAVQKQKERPFWFTLRTTILKDLPFVYEDAVTIATLDGDGRIKESNTFKQEFMFVDGVGTETILEVNGVPPPAKALAGGQIWIDDAELEITRLEIEFVEDVTSGFGLFGRVYAGTRYYMELAKQIDGLWLPLRAETDLQKRVLISRSRERFTVVFGNYRAFSVSVTIR